MKHAPLELLQSATLKYFLAVYEFQYPYWIIPHLLQLHTGSYCATPALCGLYLGSAIKKSSLSASVSQPLPLATLFLVALFRVCFLCVLLNLVRLPDVGRLGRG